MDGQSSGLWSGVVALLLLLSWLFQIGPPRALAIHPYPGEVADFGARR